MTGPITHLHIDNHTYVTKLKSTVGFYDFYHRRLRVSSPASPDTHKFGVWRLAFGFRPVVFNVPNTVYGRLIPWSSVRASRSSENREHHQYRVLDKFERVKSLTLTANLTEALGLFKSIFWFLPSRSRSQSSIVVEVGCWRLLKRLRFQGSFALYIIILYYSRYLSLEEGDNFVMRIPSKWWSKLLHRQA